MIEFIDKTHTYLIDGVIVPSVSQLVQFATKKDYSKVNKKVLDLACKFGSKLHKDIEVYEVYNVMPLYTSKTEQLAFKEYLRVKNKYINKPLFEQIISYKNSYAGRFDCLDNNNLIDFKTNTKVDIESLRWQLGYYKLALEEKGVKINKCLCLSIPRLKSARWIEIEPIEKDKLLENLKDYEKFKNEKMWYFFKC